MTLVAYALRAEHTEDFGGGSLAYGPNAYTFDVGKALNDGEGKIVTDDGMLQAALEMLDGGSGPLLKKVPVGENPIIAALPEGATGTVEVGRTEPTLSEQAVRLAEAAPADSPPPELDEGALHLPTTSEWEKLERDELIDELKDRKIEFKKTADKPELAALLEADDNAKTNPGGQS